MNTKLLLIEDDKKFAGLVTEYLAPYDFDIAYAENGKIGLTMAEELQPGLIILDLMMPVLDGLSVCRQLQGWYQGRIIVLTASDEDMDEVACLEIGAHDFVSKPVHPRVLLARIRALLRRDDKPAEPAHTNDVSRKQFGQLILNNNKRQVFLSGDLVSLTDTEFELLWVLASKPDQALSRDFIMQSLRGIEHNGLDRSIDNRIVSLRKKLGDNKGLPQRIITVRGKGYLFAPDQW